MGKITSDYLFAEYSEYDGNPFYKLERIVDKGEMFLRKPEYNDFIVNVATEEIADKCFEHCRVNAIYLPAGIKRLGKMYGNKVYYDGNLFQFLSIERQSEAFRFNGTNAFTLYIRNEQGKYSLLKEVTINKKMLEDKRGDFRFIKTIKRVIENDNCLKEGMFEGCSGLKEIEFSDETRSIPNRCFASCGIEEINIPNSVKIIGDEAFKWCEKLKVFNLPDSMEYIGENVWDGCYKLKSITLPYRVEKIGKDAFSTHKVVVPTNFSGNLESVRFQRLYLYGTPEKKEQLDPNQEVFFYNEKQQDYDTWHLSDSGDIIEKRGKIHEANNKPDFSKISNKYDEESGENHVILDEYTGIIPPAITNDVIETNENYYYQVEYSLNEAGGLNELIVWKCSGENYFKLSKNDLWMVYDFIKGLLED